MTDVFITAANRTGVGSFSGSLSSLQAHDLGKIVIEDTLKNL
jgi:acetyl-CoA acetyltransferase